MLICGDYYFIIAGFTQIHGKRTAFYIVSSIDRSIAIFPNRYGKRALLIQDIYKHGVGFSVRHVDGIFFRAIQPLVF